MYRSSRNNGGKFSNNENQGPAPVGPTPTQYFGLGRSEINTSTGNKHRPEWDDSRNTWVCKNLAGLTYEIDGVQHNVLEKGLLLADDWDGDKYYWDNVTDNWVKY